MYLKADPMPWLLEAGRPPVRWRALVDLLDQPLEDPQVLAARAAVLEWPPLAALLTAQGPNGDWGRGDFYLPRAGRGTFWVLSILGEVMGSDLASRPVFLQDGAVDERIRLGCEWIFGHQREDGAFCRRRRVAGQGLVWEQRTEPCTQARILRFLIQLGYGADPRVRRGIEWLLPAQRADGMWLCRGDGGRGCLRATLDVLGLAALDPVTAGQPEIGRAARAVCGLLMQPRMSRYHMGEEWGTWEKLKYPAFGFNVISALDALGRLGYPVAEPGIAAALDYLLSRQLPDGRWPLDECWPEAPLDFGLAGAANAWVTLEALRAIQRFKIVFR